MLAGGFNMSYLYKIAIVALIFTMTSPAYSKNLSKNFDKDVNNVFASYLKQYKNLEYFSGATLSIYIPDELIKNYYYF